jgi:hypothetical protein
MAAARREGREMKGGDEGAEPDREGGRQRGRRGQEARK